MRVSNALIASTILAIVSAKTININVGQYGPVFQPNETTAEKGDVISFTFFHGNHSVVEGDYKLPCRTGTIGMPFYSGFFGQVGTGGQSIHTFNVQINDTVPIYYYCSHPQHCQKAMVGVINPSAKHSLDTYALKAQNVTQSMVETPRRPAGGTFQLNTAATSAGSPSPGITGDGASATSTGGGGGATGTANTGGRLRVGVAAGGGLLVAAVVAVL